MACHCFARSFARAKCPSIADQIIFIRSVAIYLARERILRIRKITRDVCAPARGQNALRFSSMSIADSNIRTISVDESHERCVLVHAENYVTITGAVCSIYICMLYTMLAARSALYQVFRKKGTIIRELEDLSFLTMRNVMRGNLVKYNTVVQCVDIC